MSLISPNSVLKHSSKSTKAYVPCKTKYQDSIIEDYANNSANFKTVQYQGFRMPGSNAEPKYDTCGQWGYRVCQNVSCHPGGMEYAQRFQVSCFDAYCPTCKGAWAHRQSKTATKKLKKYQKKYKTPAKHLVWSPDLTNKDFLSMGIKNLRKACRRDLKSVGFKGGMIVLHMFRDKEVQGRKIWYVSPHFHVIGFGWITVTKEWHAKSNAVIKNLGVRDSIYNTVLYQLSHASIKKGVQTVTWVAALSYNKGESPKENNSVRCPYCNDCLAVLEPTVVFKPPDTVWKDGLFAPGSFFVPTKPYVFKGDVK